MEWIKSLGTLAICITGGVSLGRIYISIILVDAVNISSSNVVPRGVTCVAGSALT